MARYLEWTLENTYDVAFGLAYIELKKKDVSLGTVTVPNDPKS